MVMQPHWSNMQTTTKPSLILFMLNVSLAFCWLPSPREGHSRLHGSRRIWLGNISHATEESSIHNSLWAR